ncbi:MAG: hypothetical protein ACP5O1_05925 [Phycisphaerae bacterium]
MRRYLKLLLSIVLLSAWVGAGVVRAADTVFPSTKGSTWKYDYSNGTVTTSTIIASSAHHITEKTTGPASMVTRLKLTTKGWVSADVGSVRIEKINGQRIKIKIIKTSGVVIPRTSLWKKGYKWSYSMQDESNDSNGPYTIVVNTSINSASKITGFKTITVPAGTFHCLRVRVRRDVTTAVHVMNQVHIQHFHQNSTEYYAKGVGLVEIKLGAITGKLKSYHIAG